MTQQSKTIYDLLYSDRNAQDILQSRNVEARVQTVEMVAPDQSLIVRITYSQGTIDVSGLEFLMPFFSTRQHRSRSYVTIPRAENEFDVQNTGDDRPPQTVTRSGDSLSCSCEDFKNQVIALAMHPKIWELMGQQPRCKHVLRVANTLNLGAFFSMPMPLAENSETLIEG